MIKKAAVKIAADDGAVVYLNGREIGRLRMGKGAITETTFAAGKNGSADVADHLMEVPSDTLVDGKNVIAVSLHQAEPASSGLFLDLALGGMSANELAEALFERRMRDLMAGYEDKMMKFTTAYRAAADEVARAALTYPSSIDTNNDLVELILESPEHPGVVDAASWLSQYQGFTDAVSDVLSKYHHASETNSFAMLMIYNRYRPDPSMASLLEKVRANHPNKTFQALAAFSLSNGVKESKKKEVLLEEAEAKIGDYAFNDRSIKPMIVGELFEMRNLNIGQMAPEIEGEDIDGVVFKLSDYRGKVVMLDFWGHW